MAPVYEQLKSDGKGNVPADVFFMKQKISNACGTFALFHALANVEAVDLGALLVWNVFAVYVLACCSLQSELLN